jgi:hypothetical protein
VGLSTLVADLAGAASIHSGNVSNSEQTGLTRIADTLLLSHVAVGADGLRRSFAEKPLKCHGRRL